LGVVRVAPTHCSGNLARAVFRDIFGTNYVDAGGGLTLTLPSRGMAVVSGMRRMKIRPGGPQQLP
jgi:hypothetical protein